MSKHLLGFAIGKCNIEQISATSPPDYRYGFNSNSELKSFAQAVIEDYKAAQADQAETIAHLQLENAKFRDVLEFYKCFSDSRISSIAQTALLNITTAEEVTHNKPDEYDMVLRREDGLHITLDIVNLTITKSGVKRFTLVLGETE